MTCVIIKKYFNTYILEGGRICDTEHYNGATDRICTPEICLRSKPGWWTGCSGLELSVWGRSDCENEEGRRSVRVLGLRENM